MLFCLHIGDRPGNFYLSLGCATDYPIARSFQSINKNVRILRLHLLGIRWRSRSPRRERTRSPSSVFQPDGQTIAIVFCRPRRNQLQSRTASNRTHCRTRSRRSRIAGFVCSDEGINYSCGLHRSLFKSRSHQYVPALQTSSRISWKNSRRAVSPSYSRLFSQPYPSSFRYSRNCQHRVRFNH